MISKVLAAGFVLLQVTDVTQFLWSKADNLTVMGILAVLVYVLHQQERKAQEHVRQLNEARLSELRSQLQAQQTEIEFLRSQIKELKSK